MEKVEECFADCFPDNILSRVKELGATRTNKELYRIGLNGENNEQAWASSYEDTVVYGTRPVSNKYNNDMETYKRDADICEYSTSTFETVREAHHVYFRSPGLCKYYKNGVLLHADIIEADGYLKKDNPSKDHVNLWKFKYAKPWDRAKKVRWEERESKGEKNDLV